MTSGKSHTEHVRSLVRYDVASRRADLHGSHDIANELTFTVEFRPGMGYYIMLYTTSL